MPGARRRLLQMFYHLILIITLQGRDHSSSFTEKETEGQRSEGICPSCFCQHWNQLRLTPGAVFSLNSVLWGLQREWMGPLPK